MARPALASRRFEIATEKTLALVHRSLVETARREHAKVMQADPRPGSFTRYVDGRLGAPEETVRPDGVIAYHYQRLDVVAQFAMETLFDGSPVDEGDYRANHTLFLDGQEVRNLANWRPGMEVAIGNYVAYARKIELGRMKMRVSGTDKVYQRALRIVRGRFGNIAQIAFTYRGIVGGALATGKAANNPAVRYPFLIIRER